MEDIDILKRKSSSPHEPEPSRKRLSVYFFMALARITRKTGQYSPHLFKGDDLAKVEWEYKAGFEDLFNRVKDYISTDILNGKDVLDAGCGWGGKTIYYAEHTSLKTISGFDLPGVYKPEISYKFASSKGVRNCSFIVSYAENMPYSDNSFDVVILDDVMEHVRDPEKVMKEILRVLRKKGIAIVKFPSFKMILAHHLDRAIRLPALHYILSMKTWASGLNYALLHSKDELNYEPFDKVVATKYCKAITENLNGLDFLSFSKIVQNSNFRVIYLKLLSFVSSSRKKNLKFTRLVYKILYTFKPLREFLSSTMLFVGEKH